MFAIYIWLITPENSWKKHNENKIYQEISMKFAGYVGDDTRNV